jgi:hypothetical protein
VSYNISTVACWVGRRTDAVHKREIAGNYGDRKGVRWDSSRYSSRFIG